VLNINGARRIYNMLGELLLESLSRLIETVHWKSKKSFYQDSQHRITELENKMLDRLRVDRQNNEALDVKIKNLELKTKNALQALSNYNHLTYVEIDKIRQSEKYKTSINEFVPQFSIIIPTHTNPKSLWDRTLESIHQLEGIRFEIIIVCETEEIYKLINIPQRFNNLDIQIIINRFSFVETPIDLNGVNSNAKVIKWLNSGTGGFLTGFNSAKYNWVIPMAHDDEFPSPNCIYDLYEEMFNSKSEIILGQIQQIGVDSIDNKIFSNNPLNNKNYGIQGSIMYKSFASLLFQFVDSYFQIANDWGVIERAKMFNLKIETSKTLMANYYPSTLWSNQTL
jgi:hypothetical protein